MAVNETREDKIRKLIGRRRDSYRNLFDPANPVAMEVLQDICKNGFVTSTTVGRRGNLNECLLNEGARRLALYILKMVYKDEKQIMREIERMGEEDHDF